MPTPEGETPYRQIAPEVGSALYWLSWFWPVQTCASFGRAEPQSYMQINLILSRN